MVPMQCDKEEGEIKQFSHETSLASTEQVSEPATPETLFGKVGKQQLPLEEFKVNVEAGEQGFR